MRLEPHGENDLGRARGTYEDPGRPDHGSPPQADVHREQIARARPHVRARVAARPAGKTQLGVAARAVGPQLDDVGEGTSQAPLVRRLREEAVQGGGVGRECARDDERRVAPARQLALQRRGGRVRTCSVGSAKRHCPTPESTTDPSGAAGALIGTEALADACTSTPTPRASPPPGSSSCAAVRCCPRSRWRLSSPRGCGHWVETAPCYRSVTPWIRVNVAQRLGLRVVVRTRVWPRRKTRVPRSAWGSVRRGPLPVALHADAARHDRPAEARAPDSASWRARSPSRRAEPAASESTPMRMTLSASMRTEQSTRQELSGTTGRAPLCSREAARR